MSSYYYLMAQLPYIIYEQKPPMSSESFKELAVAFLNKQDTALLGVISRKINTDDAQEKQDKKKKNKDITGCDFIDKWNEWEKTLKLNIARERAVKMKRENASSLEEPPVVPADAAYAAIKTVVGEGSPLDKEIMLDKARWNAIEILTGNDYFNRNSVFAYYVKLLLLERRQVFEVEKGFSEYKSLYANIIENSQYAGVSK